VNVTCQETPTTPLNNNPIVIGDAEGSKIVPLMLGCGDTSCVSEESSCQSESPGCSTTPEALEIDVARLPGLGRWVVSGFYNAFETALDELPFNQPRRILVLGGCRQRDLARRLGFMIPLSQIVVFDPEESRAEEAKAIIKCRFDFRHGELDALPFADGHFDWVLAHDWAAYINITQSPQAVLAELARVSRQVLVLSQRRPLLWSLAARLPGVKKAWQAMGFETTSVLPAIHSGVGNTVSQQLSETPWQEHRLVPAWPWDMQTLVKSSQG